MSKQVSLREGLAVSAGVAPPRRKPEVPVGGPAPAAERVRFDKNEEKKESVSSLGRGRHKRE